MKIVKRNSPRSNRGSLVRYSPMNSMLDDFFGSSFIDEDVMNPEASVWEEDNDFYIEMAIPGVSNDDIDITVTGDSVTISAEIEEIDEETEKGRKYFMNNIRSSFEQTFNLPTKVNSEAVEANYENGVLKLILPKADELKPKKIEVKI